jgi:hydrogenase/urease accessory protein HupE
MQRAILMLTAMLVLGGIRHIQAHELRPGYLELRQTGPETFAMLWKVPARDDLRLGIRPQLPENCTPAAEPLRFQTADAYTERATMACAGGIEGRRIAIDGLTATLTDVLVRLVRVDGSAQSVRLTPSIPSFVVTAIPSRFQVAGTYLRLGVEHILMGVDHLLFVLGLLLIVHNRWMLLKTITSFTVAHSLTLAVATLGYASAPLLPLNAAIALSILFLGPEIVRAGRGDTSLTLRHPWAVAFAFGLLHGFGFASGLTSMGLPRAEIPVALLLFNLGVEAGQMLFVLLIVLLERAFRTLDMRWPHWAEALPAYTVGTLGAYWTMQRTMLLLGGLQ